MARKKAAVMDGDDNDVATATRRADVQENLDRSLEDYKRQFPPATLTRGKVGSRSANETFQLKNSGVYTVDELPDPADSVGSVILCADGYEGGPCAVISDGFSWRSIAIGDPVGQEE